MKMHHAMLAVTATLLAACTPPQAPEADTPPPVLEIAEPEASAIVHPPVDAALIAVPNADFVAVEPSEIGVMAAESVEDAIAGLVTTEGEEGEPSVQVSVRTDGETATADIVRFGIPDDSVGAGHVRVEFHSGPEGWYPTNAYRRWQCRRGGAAGQWTARLCP